MRNTVLLSAGWWEDTGYHLLFWRECSKKKTLLSGFIFKCNE